MKFNYKFPIFIFILLGVLIAISLSIYGAKAETAPLVGKYAPDFSLTDLQGKKVELKEVTKQNKITILNFWATWCPPCRAEIPEFIEFNEKYAKQGVKILAVNLQESPSKVKGFVKEAGINFTVLTDIDGSVGNTYQIYAIPTTFFIDQSGKITGKIEGSTSLKNLEAKVLPILKEK